MGTAKPIIDFTKFRGIKNIGDATQTPAPFLRSAVNVDIDNDGIISRRDGRTAAAVAGNFHSMRDFLNHTLTLAVQDTNLVIIDPDYSVTVVRSGLTAGLRMEYVEVNNQVYYTNGQVYGFVENRRNGSLSTLTKLLSSYMPAGHMIEYYEGRMYVARGGVIIPSEPYDFNRTIQRKDFIMFPGRISLMKAVDDGLYVGYGSGTGFIAGRKPKEFVFKPLTSYDAVPYTGVSVDAELVSGDQPLSGKAVLWESTKGPCLGLNGGVFFNLALNTYSPPDGYEGVSIYRKNRKGTHQMLTILKQ